MANRYSVVIATSDIVEAETDGNVAVEFKGTAGSWPALWLETRTLHFERARLDCFRISDEDVPAFGDLGRPLELTVHFEGVGSGWRWHLAHVDLWKDWLTEDGDATGTEAQFLGRFTFNLWFNQKLMRVTRPVDTIDFGERVAIPHRYVLRKSGKITAGE